MNAQTAYNPLAAAPRNSTNNTVHNKTGAKFPNITEECNLLGDKNLDSFLVAPWPKNCKVYQYTNACKKYEISKDGKSIDSCDLKYNCTSYENVEPNCEEYYKEDPKAVTFFPDTGKICNFRESLYPLPPWPEGCKVF